MMMSGNEAWNINVFDKSILPAQLLKAQACGLYVLLLFLILCLF